MTLIHILRVLKPFYIGSCCIKYGSAPDIAGQGKANPLASIWSASQMLDFFGYENWGRAVLEAIEKVLVEKKHLTPDMGGTAKTSEVGDAVIEALSQIAGKM